MNTPLRAKDPRSTASRELRAVLEHASAGGPDAARLAALTNAVLAALPTPPVAKVGAWSLGGKLLVIALAVAVGASSYLALRPVAPATALPAQETAQPAPIERLPAVVIEAPERVPFVAPERPAEPPPRRRIPKASEAAPLPDELSLLQSARMLRRTSPAEALRELERHARLFPGSALSEEREAMAIALLEQLDPARAAVRLRAFDARYPGSAYRSGLAQ